MLPVVIIPDYIIVHLARPEVSAPNRRVSFKDYIKNVAFHEIYDSWPDAALTANIYCIVSLALNRIYTEFYRTQGRGYEFDITNDTSIDQKYVDGGSTGARINAIVDKIFNNYLAVVGHQEPFLTLYCDGVQVKCPGRLTQWGSYYDALSGMTPWQIIQKYYAYNLELRQCNVFSAPFESYPGYTLKEGSSGDNVQTMQLYINRILGRYSNVIVKPVDGIFGPIMKKAVTAFQQYYNLPANGEINKTSWYKISYIYGIEKALWEMSSEGEHITVGKTPPTTATRINDTGALVVELQFLLNFILVYHNEIPFVAGTSSFDSYTITAVTAFQKKFGLTADGVVGASTWKKLYDVYWEIAENAVKPPQPSDIKSITQPSLAQKMPSYPGYVIEAGAIGHDAMLIQQAINGLSDHYNGLWKINADGQFGNGTRSAVEAFQKLFGLTADGKVGKITWNKLMDEYNKYIS